MKIHSATKSHKSNLCWAKLPKSGKLEELKKNYNFLKLVSIDVDFSSHIVKFETFFWSLCEASFCLDKLFCVFETNLSKKWVKKWSISTSLLKSKAYFLVNKLFAYDFIPH